MVYGYLMDKTFPNAEIIEQGYGFTWTRFLLKYLEEFGRQERAAREDMRGLWGEYLISTSYVPHENHTKCRSFKGKEG